jgi:hypothetical protein
VATSAIAAAEIKRLFLITYFLLFDSARTMQTRRDVRCSLRFYECKVNMEQQTTTLNAAPLIDCLFSSVTVQCRLAAMSASGDTRKTFAHNEFFPV